MHQVSPITVPSNDTVSNAIALSVFQTAWYFSAAIDVVIPSCDTRNDWNSCELLCLIFFFLFRCLKLYFFDEDWKLSSHLGYVNDSVQPIYM